MVNKDNFSVYNAAIQTIDPALDIEEYPQNSKNIYTYCFIPENVIHAFIK